MNEQGLEKEYQNGWSAGYEAGSKDEKLSKKKEKPIWKKEWLWRLVGFLAVVVGNEIQSKGDWTAVNWAMVSGATLLFIGREFTKSGQDERLIESGREYSVGFDDGKADAKREVENREAVSQPNG